jgi:DNA-binding SARP family transcriptional activator
MEALKLAGRNAEAIEVFQRYRMTLRAVQDAEPSRVIQDVYRTLLAG